MTETTELFGSDTLSVSDEPVTTTMRFIHLADGTVKRPIEEVWNLLRAIDPAGVSQKITVQIEDEPLREALEALRVIKTMHKRSYAGKLYYNFVGAIGPLRAT